MDKTFEEIEKRLITQRAMLRIALANAQDRDALSALVHAKKRGIAKGILIGDTARIASLLAEMDEPAAHYDLIPCEGEIESAKMAISLVRNGGADIPMKGIMQTSAFMKAVLDKENGLLPPGALLSQATVLEDTARGRITIISDCAVNISPDLHAKQKIILNAVRLAWVLGIECPKVAVISAVEVVKESIPSTVDAKALAEMDWQDCVVDGPLALDNAVSAEAAGHKGIKSRVAGCADILLMPDLCTGNVFTKSLTFYAGLPSAGVLCGTTSPVIMTSRTDTPQNKYHSILIAMAQSVSEKEKPIE